MTARDEAISERDGVRFKQTSHALKNSSELHESYELDLTNNFQVRPLWPIPDLPSNIPEMRRPLHRLGWWGGTTLSDLSLLSIYFQGGQQEI